MLLYIGKIALRKSPDKKYLSIFCIVIGQSTSTFLFSPVFLMF